jgi:hypothetical protein
MFGYCVWYKINDTRINNIIKEISKIVNSDSFPGHITINSKLNIEEAEKIFDKNMKNGIPYFIKIGDIYQTRDNNFYALQIDYLHNGENQKRNYHISLAYRLDKPFSNNEIEKVRHFISNYDINLVNSNDINITLNDCHYSNWKHWKIINIK